MPSVLKDSRCDGCPAKGWSKYYTPDEVNEGVVEIVGQNPGDQEERDGRPFVGPTGQDMERRFLPRAGLTRDRLTIRNAIRCRMYGGNDLPPIEAVVVKKAIEHCQRVHKTLAPAPKLTIAQGAYGLYATTGETGISTWRGWLLDPVEKRHRSEIWVPQSHEPKVFATLHIAALMRDPDMTLATLMDWAKVGKVLAGRWPQPLPSYEHKPIVYLPQEFTFDTEYDITANNRLIRYSIATGERIVVTEAWMHAKSRGWLFPSERPTVICQNALADVDHWERLSGQSISTVNLEDTMLCHSVLATGCPHDLDYLGSLYSSLNRWKHLAHTEPTKYSAADAWGTLEVWRALKAELARDPLSEKIYRERVLPLIPIILKARSKGIKVDAARTREVSELLKTKTHDAQLRAEAIAGWPLQLSSTQQLGHHLAEIDKLPLRGKRGH